MKDKTELYKCDFCNLLWEGLVTDDCPKCKHHFFHIVARYPSFSEEEQLNEEELNNELINAEG